MGLTIGFCSANRRSRGGRAKDLLVSKSEFVLLVQQQVLKADYRQIPQLAGGQLQSRVASARRRGPHHLRLPGLLH